MCAMLHVMVRFPLMGMESPITAIPADDSYRPLLFGAVGVVRSRSSKPFFAFPFLRHDWATIQGAPIVNSRLSWCAKFSTHRAWSMSAKNCRRVRGFHHHSPFSQG
jgi:hypothetical protein